VSPFGGSRDNAVTTFCVRFTLSQDEWGIVVTRCTGKLRKITVSLLAVNRLVAGSNPARGAKQNQILKCYPPLHKSLKLTAGQHLGQQITDFA
jgi:hypothetical protein